jgi:hypothetical protein
VLFSALKRLPVDTPTWLAKVIYIKVCALCNDPLHHVCFYRGLCIGVYITPVADPRPLANGTTDTQRMLGLAIPRPTEIGAEAEKMPSTNAVRSVTVEEPQNDTVSDGGQGTVPYRYR